MYRALLAQQGQQPSQLDSQGDKKCQHFVTVKTRNSQSQIVAHQFEILVTH